MSPRGNEDAARWRLEAEPGRSATAGNAFCLSALRLTCALMICSNLFVRSVWSVHDSVPDQVVQNGTFFLRYTVKQRET